MSGLRTLDDRQIASIAGGYYEGDIVIVDRHGNSWSASVMGGSMYGGGSNPNEYYMDDRPTFEGGGGNPSDEEYQSAVSDLISTIAGAVNDWALQKQAQQHEREMKLKDSFDPNNIAIEQHVQGSPSITYVMSNGDIFIDSDGKNGVDQRAKYSPSGTLFIDDGDGWKPAN